MVSATTLVVVVANSQYIKAVMMHFYWFVDRRGCGVYTRGTEPLSWHMDLFLLSIFFSTKRYQFLCILWSTVLHSSAKIMCTNGSVPMLFLSIHNDWFNYWLNDWLTDWLIAWLIYILNKLLTDSLTYWSPNWLIDLLYYFLSQAEKGMYSSE